MRPGYFMDTCTQLYQVVVASAFHQKPQPKYRTAARVKISTL